MTMDFCVLSRTRMAMNGEGQQSLLPLALRGSPFTLFLRSYFVLSYPGKFVRFHTRSCKHLRVANFFEKKSYYTESSTFRQNGILVLTSTARGGGVRRAGYEFLFSCPRTPPDHDSENSYPFFWNFVPFWNHKKNNFSAFRTKVRQRLLKVEWTDQA